MTPHNLYKFTASLSAVLITALILTWGHSSSPEDQAEYVKNKQEDAAKQHSVEVEQTRLHQLLDNNFIFVEPETTQLGVRLKVMEDLRTHCLYFKDDRMSHTSYTPLANTCGGASTPKG